MHVSCTSKYLWVQLTNVFCRFGGCGKTTLKDLLHRFILDKSAFVNSQLSWPPKESQGSSLLKRLQSLDPAYPRDDGPAYLLFDEGQDSYENMHLWNGFLKRVCDGSYPSYRVVMFCSYGSPSSRPMPDDIPKPTNLVLRDTAHISLWPREGSAGSISILLNRSEFDDVVSRFHHKLYLHHDLQDLIFQWTVGHVGVVVEILNMISYQVGLLRKSRVGCLLMLLPRE